MKISIKNFRTISNLDLEFGGGNTLVWGQNGFGKSNIALALQWVLTGRAYIAENKKASLDEIIQKGADSCFVRYEDEHLIVNRSNGKEKSLEVFIDGVKADGNPKEVQKQLQRHLGVEGWKESEIGLEWLRVANVSPDSPTIFDMDGAELGVFLSSLFRLEIFQRLKRSFTEDANKAKSEVDHLTKNPVEKYEIANVTQLIAAKLELEDTLTSVPNAQLLVQLGYSLADKRDHLQRTEFEREHLEKTNRLLLALVTPVGLEAAKTKLAEIDHELSGKKRLSAAMVAELETLNSRLQNLKSEKLKLDESASPQKPEIPLASIEHDLELCSKLAQEARANIGMLKDSLNGKPCPACGAELLVTMSKLELLDKPKVEALLETERTKLQVWNRNIELAAKDKELWKVYQDSLVAKERLRGIEREEENVRAQISRLEKEIEAAKLLEPLFGNRAVVALKVSELERAEREFREQERSLLNRKAELEAKVNQIPALEKEIIELEAKIALGESHKGDFERLESLKVSIARAEMQNKLAEQYWNWVDKLGHAKKRYELLDRCKSEANYILATQIRLRKAEFENRMNQALSEMELEHQVKIDLEETSDGEIKGVGIEVWSRGDWRIFHSGINKASQTVLKTVAALVQRNLFESRLKVPFVIVDDPGFGCQNDVLENLYAGLKTLTKGRTIVLTAWKGAEALLRPEKVYQLQMINNETRLA